jgi:NAD(P)H:quinone oxidoreductase type IV
VRLARKSHYKMDQAAPVAKVEDMAAYDAIIIGAGTQFGRLSSQMANFLDQAGGLWMRGALHGKVGGALTSTATQHGGQETTLFSIITNLLHFGMLVVGLDYGHAGQMTLDEITGGSPYGATTIAGGDSSRDHERARRSLLSRPEDCGDRKQAARLKRSPVPVPLWTVPRSPIRGIGARTRQYEEERPRPRV